MQNWKFAISSIMSHKLRSFLTMVGIIIGVASVVVIMALGDGMKAGVTKTFTKDQEYVQISYSPNKSGYVTGINIGPSDDTGEGEGGGRKVALQLKTEGWLLHQISMGKMQKILTVKSKKHRQLCKNLGLRN